MDQQQSEMLQILDAWNFGAPVETCTEYGEGHINRTYLVTAGPRRYILQKINRSVFRDVDGLMRNIDLVTSFLRTEILRQGGDPDRETLTVIRTADGRLYHEDENGAAWRVYLFITGSLCLQSARTEQDFAESAAAFGRFQKALSSFPAAELSETIPHFHDTPKRFQALMDAVQKDPCGRRREVERELDFIRQRESQCSILTDARQSGRLPLRVTHNDTKLNNVLFDANTGKELCIIDLDTVMPGLAADDFGDAIRFGANDCAEDEPDQSRCHFSLPLYRIYRDSYLAACGDALTETEREMLPWGAKLMTLECGMRFLTDYLEGDTYFRISRPAQNLDRARTQLKLVSDMESCWEEMSQKVRG